MRADWQGKRSFEVSVPAADFDILNEMSIAAGSTRSTLVLAALRAFYPKLREAYERRLSGFRESVGDNEETG